VGGVGVVGMFFFLPFFLIPFPLALLGDRESLFEDEDSR
jgi:hypothetical protein